MVILTAVVARIVLIMVIVIMMLRAFRVYGV